MSQRRLSKASFPARDDPRPLRTFLPRETPFPEAAAWRLAPPPAPCLPQTPRRCRLCPNESQSGPRPPFLHLIPWTPFSPCHQPSPGHPGLTAAPRLWGDRTCGGGRWADSCCGLAVSRGHPSSQAFLGFCLALGCPPNSASFGPEHGTCLSSLRPVGPPVLLHLCRLNWHLSSRVS